MVEGLGEIRGILLYGSKVEESSASIALLNIEGLNSEEVAFALDKKYDIAARGGLHCSADAHRTLGMLDRGAVRISLGYFNNEEEIERVIKVIAALAKRAK